MQKLKELRKSASLKQQQLAQILNLDTSSISKYETGKATPSPDVLLKIANYFHVTTDYLLENSMQKHEEIDPHNNSGKNTTNKNDLEKIIHDYVVNKELFQPDSDSYEDLKKIMAEIISNNENIILEILNNRRNLNERK